MHELKELPKLADTYYHIKLVPKKCSLEGYNNDIDIYVKGRYLSLLIADTFILYNIKIIEINHNGYIL